MKSKRYWFGVLVSIGWLAFCGWLIFIRWCHVKTMPLNEYGDFMAGVFAPLAFLWLVLGYLQQGEELKLSTDALHLQAKELANSVQQQAALVDVSRQQVEAARDAMKYEQIQKEHDAQPKFTVILENQAVYTNSAEYELRLTNSGAAVRDVKVGFKYGQEVANVVREFPIFAEFSNNNVRLYGKGPFVSDSELMIEYETLTSKRGLQKFHIRMNTNNQESAMSITKLD